MGPFSILSPFLSFCSSLFLFSSLFCLSFSPAETKGKKLLAKRRPRRILSTRIFRICQPKVWYFRRQAQYFRRLSTCPLTSRLACPLSSKLFSRWEIDYVNHSNRQFGGSNFWYFRLLSLRLGCFLSRSWTVCHFSKQYSNYIVKYTSRCQFDLQIPRDR